MTGLMQEEKSNKEELSNITKTDEASTDLLQILPLEGDEEKLKEWKGLKTLTPSKILTTLPTSLTQIKTGNNSKKLKKEIRQILCWFINIMKIAKTVYKTLIKSL